MSNRAWFGRIGALTLIVVAALPTRAGAQAFQPVRTLVTPDPPIEGFQMGRSLAAIGTSLVVGVPRDNIGAAGAGSAVVLSSHDFASLDPASGLRLDLFNPTPGAGDEFGKAVAVLGTNVIVGAPGKDGGKGAAYLFDGTTGALLQTFVKPGGAAGDNAGAAVAGCGTTVIVGAPGQGSGAGAVHLFDVTTGGLITSIANPAGAANDRFGFAVAAGGPGFAVGAPSNDTGGGDRGLVYLYDCSGAPAAAAIANPSGANLDQFGSSLVFQGTNLLVGAPGTAFGSGTPGKAKLVDALPGSPSYGQLVRSYAKATPANGDAFGSSVASDGTRVLVGAPLDATGAAGAGAAYQFNAATGALTQSFVNTVVGDNYGASVALVEGLAFVGAPANDTAAPGAGAVFRGLTQHAAPVTATTSANFGRTAVVLDDDIFVAVAQTVAGNPVPSGPAAGGAVFQFDGATGTLLRRYDHGIGVVEDFGRSMATLGTALLVGAPCVVGSTYGNVTAYDAVSGSTVRVFTMPPGPDGNGGVLFGGSLAAGAGVVAIGGPIIVGGTASNARVFLFDYASGGFLRTIVNPSSTDTGFAASIAIDGTGLAVAGTEATRVYDTGSGSLLCTFAGAQRVAAAGGKVLAGGKRYDVATCTLEHDFGSFLGGTFYGANVLLTTPPTYFDGVTFVSAPIQDPAPTTPGFGGQIVAWGTTKVVLGNDGSAYVYTQVPNICGNALVETGEQCDDGNTTAGDCCSATCQFETGSCDDDNPCTTPDTCSGGVCHGTPKNCADTNSCTIDSCRSDGQCRHTTAPNNTPCSDGNICTGHPSEGMNNDRCQGGTCVSSPCSDGFGEICPKCPSGGTCQPAGASCSCQ